MAKKLPMPLLTIGKQRDAYFLNIRRIDSDDVKALIAIDPQKIQSRTDYKDREEYVYCRRRLTPQAIELAKNGGMVLSKAMLAAINYLDTCGKYAPTNIETLNSEACAAIVGEHATKEQREEIEANADALWEEIIKKLHTPRVQELLTSLDAIVNALPKDLKWFGHKISYKNGLLALSQRPDVQFVATRDNWKKLYNRQVKPNAKPIYLYAKLDNTRYSDEEVKNSEVSKYGQEYNPSRMQKYKNTVDMHFRNQGIQLVPYFDLKDTEIYNPNDKDYFNAEQGLSNNITGKLNKWAQKERDDAAAEEIDPSIEQELTKTFDIHQEDAKPDFYALSRGVAKKMPSIKPPKVRDDATSSEYVEAFETLCKQVADSLITDMMQIVKPENRTPKIDAVTSIVMLLAKLMPVSKIKPINDEHLIRQDYLDVRNVVVRIINLINSNMLSNEITIKEDATPIPNITSNEQYEDILSQLGVDLNNVPTEDDVNDEDNVNDENGDENTNEIQEVKNNFFNVLNKLNIPWD